MSKIPFRKEELEIRSSGPTAGRFAMPLLNTPITPRENFLRFLRREDPLWAPLSCDTAMLTPACVPDNISRGFVFEALPFNPNESGGGPDMFGVEWEWVPTAGGSMVRPGKPKVEDITEWEKDITFPDLDAWDWESAAARNRERLEKKDLLVNITILNGLFERLISFVDMNEALVAMVDEDGQEGVHRLFDRLADFYPKLIRKYKEYFDVDLITFHDDWGSQRAPFFSLDTVREMLVPYLKRIVDATHEMGIYFELHSCGKNELLVPAMIEAGVDMWNGQPMNDKKMLCELYSDKILLGASPTDITNQSTPEEVEAGCRAFADTFGQYPTYWRLPMGAPNARALLYEYSRVAKCGRAG